MNYRKDIYSKYDTNFQPEGRIVLSDLQFQRWARACDYYFRGWLPTSKNALIADLGCGAGRLLRYFKERGYNNISGVDASPAQITLARTVTDSVYSEDLFTFLDTRHRTFDLITGIDLIEHLSKEECIQFLKYCYHALKPGGRIILQTPNSDSPMFPSTRYNDLTHEVGFNAHSLNGIIQHLGFQFAEPRETGPLPIHYGLKTGIRYMLWKVLKLAISGWNLVEIGNIGSGVYTRVFLVSALKVEKK